MKTIDFSGWSVIILSIAVAYIIIASTTSPLLTGFPLSDAKAELLSNIVVAVIAIIGVYIGKSLSDN